MSISKHSKCDICHTQLWDTEIYPFHLMLLRSTTTVPLFSNFFNNWNLYLHLLKTSRESLFPFYDFITIFVYIFSNIDIL
jgi:hypothetical protein